MFCTSIQPTHGVMPLEGARCWSTTVITHYSFVPEKCQGRSVSVPEKEQKQTSKPWRLLWNRSVFLGPINKAFKYSQCWVPSHCWWGAVSCMAGRYVSSLVTKHVLGCGFTELFQAELGSCVLPVLWYWYRGGWFSVPVLCRWRKIILTSYYF